MRKDGKLYFLKTSSHIGMNMMQNIGKFEFRFGEKSYIFLCDLDSPIGDVKEAIFQFQKSVAAIEDQIKALQAEKEKADAAKKDELAILEVPDA